MATRKSVLEGLPRNRLLDIARSFEIKGLTASSKDEIADALASNRSIPIVIDDRGNELIVTRAIP